MMTSSEHTQLLSSRSLTARLRTRLDVRTDVGSTLIEVMISAVLMLVISTSVYGALEATSRAGAQERHRARAYALAQDDQARVRSLKTSQLSALSETNTVVEDGITYTVTSTGTPTLDRTADSTCESGNTSADYVAISSKVTWTSIGSRPPVVVDSIIAPPNGTLDPDRGALAISILDSRSNPYAGIQVNGTGTSTFSGTTNSAGCVIFGNLPQGNYTVTPSVSNLVDADGNPPGAISTSVVGQSSNTLGLQYDRPGTVNVTFRTKVGNGYVTSYTDSITAFNTGMAAPKTYGTAGGTTVSSFSASSLFPFTSPYTIYAGTCSGNDPSSGAAVITPTVPVAGATSGQITLPALNLSVYNGSGQYGSQYYGALVNGAKVTLTDTSSGCTVKRTMTTNSSGKLADTARPTVNDPGIPYGTYNVCVSGPEGLNGTIRKVTTNNVVVQDPANPKALTVYLYDGQNGACP